MTLDQLRIFVAVAEREHLTRAAEALRLTPSAVSAAVNALESRHGVRLFHRTGRRIELSETGRVFLIEAKATLTRAALAERTLAELSGLQRGSLTINASQTIASYWLPAHLAAFKRRHGGIDIHLHEGNSQGVTQAVLDGTADLGFVESDIVHPALSVLTAAQDRLVIVAAPGHPLIKEVAVPANALIDAVWILRESGSGTRAMFEKALRARGIDPSGLKVMLELPTNEAVCAAARSGPLLTVVSELVARPHLEAGRLCRVPFEAGTRLFSLITHKERYQSKAAGAFVASLPREPESWAGAGI